MTLYKLSFSFCIVLLVGLFFFCNSVFANNASYITLSNQIAQNRQLEVVANNVANSNTPGYRQDAVLLSKTTLGKKIGQKHDFVAATATYDSGRQGALKSTGRPTDIAINEDGYYFKVLTPQGERYTLDGSMFISHDNLLVNSEGYPYADNSSSEISIPEQFQDITITKDGNIFVNGEAVATIGVFGFQDHNSLIKEGNRLYSSANGDIQITEYTIATGFIRMSNVNSTESMTKMVEMQRSTGVTNNLMSNISSLEKSAVNKVMK